MKLNNFLLVNGVDMSADIASAPYLLDNVYGLAIQVEYQTGAPAGTLKLQASCDDGFGPGNDPAPLITNWTDIQDSPVVISATGSTLYNMQEQNYKWVRVVFTADMGSTGSLTAIVNSKGF